MAATVAITIDEKPVKAQLGQTILDACKAASVDIPVMCHFEGLQDVGACRLCLVQVDGVPKLLPACTTKVAENMVIRTQTEKLQRYRRMTTELLFAERNHVCSVCIANGHCDLQELGYKVGMDHVRYAYLNQPCDVDASHRSYVIDHNRCILCTRCVRVCAEVEGAHNWNLMNRGYRVRIVSDFNQPWGESTTCTACGKCVEICPTGALWPKDVCQGQLQKQPETVSNLVARRGMGL